MLSPTITIRTADGQPKFTLIADSANLSFDEKSGSLEFICYNGEIKVDQRWKPRAIAPGRWVERVQVVDPNARAESNLSPADLTHAGIARQIAHEQKTVQQLQRQWADAAQQETFHNHRKRLYRLRAERPRRWANGFACLGFALVGIPVAMWRRSADYMSVFFICFTPIMLAYYPLLVIGEQAARAGVFPELSVWLADTVLLVVGGILWMKFLRR